MAPYMTKAAVLIVAATLNGFIQTITTTDAFMIAPTPTASRQSNVLLHSSPSTTTDIHDGITINDKIELRDPTPEERGKGGVQVIGATDSDSSSINALEVLARIPRSLVISSADMPPRAFEAVSNGRNLTWATELTAATLTALHPTEEEISATAGARAKKDWVESWPAGGWGNANDLGADIAADVVGTLLATGSDNDHNIYAKFRMPCHPGVFKASMGLELLTKCTGEEARAALAARGFTYRSVRDALQDLVLEATLRPEKKGSKRDKRSWDVADTLDRVLARATTVQLDDEDATSIGHAIVPIHERLAHSLNANTKLVSIGDEILLVATRDIEAGEAVTRDYVSAPRMANEAAEVGSALHLLLQFGLPPSAWAESSE